MFCVLRSLVFIVSYVFCRIAAYDGKQTAVKVFNSVGVGAIAHMGLWLVCKSMNRGHQPVYNRLTEHGLMYGNHSNTQLNEHVRTQVLTPQCPHLFNTTTYETTRLLLYVLIYLQFRSGRLCNQTRYPGATKTYLNVL